MTELNGKYVNEQNHKKIKKVLMTIGFILISIAVVLIVFGIIFVCKGRKLMNTDMDSSTWFEDSSKGGNYLAGGIVMLSFALMFIFSSIALFVQAHTRELASFAASSVAPVTTDVLKYTNKELAPEIGNTINTIKQSVTTSKNATTTCPSCGKENQKSNKFCAYCGAEMEKHRRCTQCGAELEQDSSFCTSCGKKIEK